MAAVYLVISLCALYLTWQFEKEVQAIVEQKRKTLEEEMDRTSPPQKDEG